MPSGPCFWLRDEYSPTCVCIGTGRFLRSVLVPLLRDPPVLVQTRGRSFVDDSLQRVSQDTSTTGVSSYSSYPVDTVLPSGTVETTEYKIAGAFSLGHDKEAVYEHLVPTLTRVRLIGVGVTEAGLASSTTTAMQDLYELLVAMSRIVEMDEETKDGGDSKPTNKSSTIGIVNTDNFPHNGAVLKQHMLVLADKDTNNKNMVMEEFIHTRLVWFDSMVDRITSHRPDDPLVPRAEPVPAKALVVLDPHAQWPSALMKEDQSQSQESSSRGGLVLRSTRADLDADLALKLRVANGTHTAVAHVLALCGKLQTDALVRDTTNTGRLVLEYVDALVRDQIKPAAVATVASSNNVKDVWDDWRGRLTHAHFGLSTFFITQNGAAKGGIRWGPTVTDLLIRANSKNTTSSSSGAGGISGVTVTFAFAYAVLLRWVTPRVNGGDAVSGVYTGWLNGFSSTDAAPAKDGSSTSTVVEYADGLRYDLAAGWYEFRCACDVTEGTAVSGSSAVPLASWLGRLSSHEPRHQPSAFVPVIRAYLTAPNGGSLDSEVNDTVMFHSMINSIATLYARMVAGDDLMDILRELQTRGFSSVANSLSDIPSLSQGRPLHYCPRSIPDTSELMRQPVDAASAAAVVVSEVASTRVIDLHTHLLPPSHGPLCLWGIDELLSYHYLVAEYFITAPPSITPELFYAKTKRQQADLVWKALFLDRSPLSEAARGVITTLLALGLTDQVRARDLSAIRDFYSTYREDGLTGAERFSEVVHRISGVRYNVMTNIPFNANETQHWRPHRKEYAEHYRSALRVDPLLSGDYVTVNAALKSSGYNTTLEGARQYIRDWCDTMKPEYLMASTPHDFVLASTRKTGINEEAMQIPGAFAFVSGGGDAGACNGADDDSPSMVDEDSDLLSEVLMPVCQELDLPLALKIGAHRGVNPRLRQAGDGVVTFADAGVLGRLCARFPKVRFLATFLSRNNQHEACVLATKFGNLHIYGCWWYCFTPSIVKEVTSMRIEMLGTAFTAQHSDARVLDQLIYKWSHSRAVLADVIRQEVEKLCATGWNPTRAEIRQDIQRMFGGSYVDFMAKSFQ